MGGITVRSWLGEEYWRLRGDAMDITREQSYGILQDALKNYVRWVSLALGTEVWKPFEPLEDTLGMPY